MFKSLLNRISKASERWFRVDCWGTGEWKIGFGWWDQAFELYLGKRIIRFDRHEADFR